MCVSLPMQVVKVESETALVSDGHQQFEVGRRLLPDAQAGDWVLVYAAQMVSVIATEEAQVIRELWNEISKSSQVNVTDLI